MKIVRFILPVLLFSMSLYGASVTERKKNLEKRIRQLENVHAVFQSEKSVKVMNDLQSAIQDFETAYSLTEQKEIVRKLAIAEKTANFAEVEIAALLEEKSARLIELFDQARAPAGDSHSEVSPKKILPASREKIVRLFKMAKDEYLNGQKYNRDRNWFFAINLFKRSIRYSLKGIAETGNTVTEEFSAAKDWH